MTASPRFSVVIPAYNAGATISATIRSLLLQSEQDFEAIVVDDGSTDDTVDRVQSIADARFVVTSQENAGPSAARNNALSRARGLYVCPLDADDLLLPEFLRRLGGALDRNSRAGFAYTDAYVLDGVSGKVRRPSAMAWDRPPRPAPQDPSAFLRELCDRNFVYGCTVMRRSALEQVGGYATDLPQAEDYDLWLRIVAHGWQAAAVPGRLAVHRELPTSNSTNRLSTVRSAQRVFERMATEYPIDEATRERALAARDRWAMAEQEIVEPGGSRPRGAFVTVARRVKRVLVEPWRWYHTPPAEVSWLLDATR